MAMTSQAILLINIGADIWISYAFNPFWDIFLGGYVVCGTIFAFVVK
jgi:hypothetical protein